MIKIISGIGLIICLLACARFIDQDLDAVYIHIPRLDLKTNPGQFQTQQIKDLWLFVDDIYEGTFPVPSRIPLFRQETFRLKIYPGIRQYGILSSPEIYTLMDPFQADINTSAQDSIVLSPAFSYKGNMITFLQEGFETGSIFIFDLDSFPGHTLVRSSSMFREGFFSGSATISAPFNSLEVGSPKLNILKNSWPSAYLELDFKSEIEISLGLITSNGVSSDKKYFFTLRPSMEWKKVYIPLTAILNAINNESVQLALKTMFSATTSTVSFHIDNIRIIGLP